jgi:hypothetical protein
MQQVGREDIATVVARRRGLRPMSFPCCLLGVIFNRVGGHGKVDKPRTVCEE